MRKPRPPSAREAREALVRLTVKYVTEQSQEAAAVSAAVFYLKTKVLAAPNALI